MARDRENCGVISGRIVAADTGKPLRRARITANAPELGGETPSTSTSVEGRYELKDLPAGRYAIRVTRSGYLSLQFGQRRPLEQGSRSSSRTGSRWTASTSCSSAPASSAGKSAMN
jgi:Carboxypeptidase regulatory-like domain